MNGAAWFFIGFGSALFCVCAAWFANTVAPLENRRFESTLKAPTFIRIVGDGMSFAEDDWSVLADYNAEIARGIAHIPEWDAVMADMQVRWNIAHNVMSYPEPEVAPKAGEPVLNLLEKPKPPPPVPNPRETERGLFREFLNWLRCPSAGRR